MSVYLRLRCLDHTPPIIADYESGQHMYDLPRIRAEIAEHLTAEEWKHAHDLLVVEWQRVGASRIDADRYFRMHSAHFLRHHPTCRLDIVDEYGDTHPAEEPTP